MAKVNGPGGVTRYFLWPERTGWGGYALRVVPERAGDTIFALLRGAGLSNAALAKLRHLREVTREEYEKAEAAYRAAQGEGHREPAPAPE